MGREGSGSDERPTVVVGVDGSEMSDAAVRWVRDYAEAFNADVHVIATWESRAMYGGVSPPADVRHRCSAQAIVEAAIAELGLPPERLQSAVVEGFPGEVLVRASETADLLVVGSKGHGPVGGLLLGSVSTHCLHYAKIPVAVVR